MNPPFPQAFASLFRTVDIDASAIYIQDGRTTRLPYHDVHASSTHDVSVSFSSSVRLTVSLRDPVVNIASNYRPRAPPTAHARPGESGSRTGSFVSS